MGDCSFSIFMFVRFHVYYARMHARVLVGNWAALICSLAYNEHDRYGIICVHWLIYYCLYTRTLTLIHTYKYIAEVILIYSMMEQKHGQKRMKRPSLRKSGTIALKNMDRDLSNKKKHGSQHHTAGELMEQKNPTQTRTT